MSWLEFGKALQRPRGPLPDRSRQELKAERAQNGRHNPMRVGSKWHLSVTAVPMFPLQGCPKNNSMRGGALANGLSLRHTLRTQAILTDG